jgi:predicted Zn-dependent protease with MMP-like domain
LGPGISGLAFRGLAFSGGYGGVVPIEITRERFEELVDAALDEIPEEIAALVQNVVVLVEDEAPPDDPDLLGLYDGVALIHRQANHSFELPDRIFVFRNNLVDMCDSEEELVDEVRITVVHEIAHFFGIDHDVLHELGYD